MASVDYSQFIDATGRATCTQILFNYRKISNIRRTKSQIFNVPRLGMQLSLRNILKPSVKVENEDVVGAAPTGDAPTTSERSTI